MKQKTNDNIPEIGNRAEPYISGTAGEEPPPLRRREKNDPMRLLPAVLKELDNYFLKRGLTYIPGQRELLSHATEAVLQAEPGTVTAIPFQPGLGKSTLIRALLTVFAQEFQKATPIAQAIGGTIVVVEKTAEAEELEALCNSSANDRPIARAISSPNDYNLGQGRCSNGTASSYTECTGRSCPDYSTCALVQSAQQTHDTPVLIMLHARYQQFMEDLSPFLSWSDEAGKHTRTLLLVDELPPLIEENKLNLETINQLESELSQLKPSYCAQNRKEKSSLLYSWNQTIRGPFFRLMRTLPRSPGLMGMLTREELEAEGFTEDSLVALQDSIAAYTKTGDHRSIQLIDALRQCNGVYYSIGQDTDIFIPQLRRLHGGPATFLFSGTASLSPELSWNPDIRSFNDENLESFRRLQVNIQRGNLFNASKSGLEKNYNLAGLIAWLKFLLPQITRQHRKVLVVTYKAQASHLWYALRDFHDKLIPYIGSDGHPQSLLPYFGGMNGSNLYQAATCVVCVGLNRFEPRDYLSRTLALDFTGEATQQIQAASAEEQSAVRIDQMPCVLDTQDITLARDIVQLVFRSALRRHGEKQPVDLWLLQPPNGVVGYLLNYFKDCRVQEHSELPEDCQLAVAAGKTYRGNQTHAGKLLDFLSKWDGKADLTPTQIRDETGLSLEQFKEAKKKPEVKDYFNRHITTKGSGKNTVYSKIVT